jgi:putative Holliday junction resolvase
MSQVFLRQRDSVEPCQGTLVDTLARSGCGVASIKAHMRVVGVDVGTRRIGLAVSDPSGTLSRPLGVVMVAALDATAVTAVTERVRALAEEDGRIASLVVGLPRRLNGRPTDMTARVEAFGRRLAEACGVAVHFQDERLSSHEAETRLALREKDWRVRKQQLDAMSAAIILQDYLDTHAASPVVDEDLA